jgi:hypothetical protein
MKLTTYLKLVPSLRMRVAMLALQQMPSWHAKIYFHLHHRFKLLKYKSTEKDYRSLFNIKNSSTY